MTNLLSHASTVIIESEGKVSSVGLYIHNVNPKMRLKDMAMWIYKMAAKYNRKWHCSIRRPRKPHTRNKHGVDRTMRRWDMAIWSFQNGRRPPSWIWSNRKWRRSSCRPRKPLRRTKHEVGRLTRCWVMAIWNFPIRVNIWPEVGRWSVVVNIYFLHWSHILLFRYV